MKTGSMLSMSSYTTDMTLIKSCDDGCCMWHEFLGGSAWIINEEGQVLVNLILLNNNTGLNDRWTEVFSDEPTARNYLAATIEGIYKRALDG